MHKLSRRQTVASILAAGASAAVPATLAARDDGSAVHVSFLLVNDIYRIEEKDGRGGMARFAAVVSGARQSARRELPSYLRPRRRYAVAELVVELRPRRPHGRSLQ